MLLDREQFARAIKLGLGRAILHAQSHDVSQHRDSILQACLHTPAIHPEMEGTRARFLYDIVSLIAPNAEYHRAVLEAIPGAGDTWNAVHRSRYACYLALDGDENARRVLYESYQPGPRFGEMIGCNFVDLDGMDGFLFAVRRISTGSGCAVSGFLLDYARSELGDAAVPAVQAYIRADRVRPSRPRAPRPKRTQPGEHLAREHGATAHRELLERWIAMSDPAQLHDFGMDLQAYWRLHPDSATEPELLRRLYEQGPCSFCRSVAVGRMLELGILPPEWREECRFDSDQEVRDLVSP